MCGNHVGSVVGRGNILVRNEQEKVKRMNLKAPKIKLQASNKYKLLNFNLKKGLKF